MTQDVRTWATQAGQNNISGALFPENQSPSSVNDSARQMQAAIRSQWNKAQWFALGDRNGPATFTFLSSTSFRLQGSQLASEYHIGRRVRATGTATGTIVGTITAVSSSSGNTDVTVNWDSGSLSSESLLIELATMTAVDSSHPAIVPHTVTFSSAIAMLAAVTIGGAATISGALTAPSGTFTSGPFTFLSAVRRLHGGATITVPAGTKQMVIEMWSPGGGGSSENSSSQGTDGGTLTLTSTPGSHQIVLPGGLKGGAAGAIDNGQDQATATGVSSSGSFAALLDIPGMGAPGGVGGEAGITGNAGHYVRAVINSTSITSFALSGGAPGNGGTDNADGGNGGRGAVLVSFYG